MTASQSFDAVNAGGRVLSVDAGYTMDDGNGGNNYLVTVTDAAGTIHRRDVVVTVDADDKIYDGNTVATGAVTGITGVISGDDVFSDGTATFAFADKHVGANKAVAVNGMTLAGADALNYRLASAGASNASITPKVPPARCKTATPLLAWTAATTCSPVSSPAMWWPSIIRTPACSRTNTSAPANS